MLFGLCNTFKNSLIKRGLYLATHALLVFVVVGYAYGQFPHTSVPTRGEPIELAPGPPPQPAPPSRYQDLNDPEPMSTFILENLGEILCNGGLANTIKRICGKRATSEIASDEFFREACECIRERLPDVLRRCSEESETVKSLRRTLEGICQY